MIYILAMWIDEELPPELAERLKAICTEGEEFAMTEDGGPKAIAKFREAYEIVPEPKHHFLATTWILAAIGDNAFLDNDLVTATEAFQEIGLCEGWHDNPFVRLRRGQVAFENGDMKRASDELASAFMLGGYEIFDAVDDKYPEFVLAQMRPPNPPVDHPLARFHMP